MKWRMWNMRTLCVFMPLSPSLFWCDYECEWVWIVIRLYSARCMEYVYIYAVHVCVYILHRYSIVCSSTKRWTTEMESAHFDSIKQIIIYHHVAIMSSLLFRAVNGEANEIEWVSERGTQIQRCWGKMRATTRTDARNLYGYDVFHSSLQLFSLKNERKRCHQ